MSYRTLPDSKSQYALVSFDADGNERTDDPAGAGGPFSTRVLADITSAKPTDVFLFCHGWKGDVPAAIDQYDRWIGAMLRTVPADLHGRRPGFSPFWIGVHWPSQPWGDEELGGAASFAPQDPVAAYVERFGDRPGLRDAITQVFAAAAREPAAETLPPDAEEAYRRINALLTEVGAAGPAAAPDADREPFDPQTYFEALREEGTSFDGGGLGGILGPLRQLSFWKMKERGRAIGEGDLHAFLLSLQKVDGPIRIHLMGHSFGCIVVSAMLCGPKGGVPAGSVASLALVQGALSLWSYCEDIPVAAGSAGYFDKLVEAKLVRGPIVTTRSIYDRAVGRFYPLGAGVAGQVTWTVPVVFPKYGAVGAFGAQAIVPGATDLPMKPADQPYPFEAGRLYNVEASDFIRKGSGASGAHSDIDGPEVAHMIWSAALCGP